jgi:hypothetical protein
MLAAKELVLGRYIVTGKLFADSYVAQVVEEGFVEEGRLVVDFKRAEVIILRGMS